jgi:membrane protein
MNFFKLIFEKFELFLKKIIEFFKTDIWKQDETNFSGLKKKVYHSLRVLVLSAKGFKEDECGSKSSALTFFSLLSFVPVMAMLFAIAGGFGLDSLLEELIISKTKGNAEAISYMLTFAHSMIAKMKSGFVAGIGVLVLFWTVIKVLNTIEKTLNSIWGINKSRPLPRKFSDYMSIMLIAPIFVILSGSLTMILTSKVQDTLESYRFIQIIGPVLTFMLEMIPYILIWTAFSLLYIIMPNTRVKPKNGIIAGIIAGTAYQLLQMIYLHFQLSLSTYDEIYGNFAVLPLLMIWLQISWFIILFGAELAHSLQTVFKYHYEIESHNLSWYDRKVLSILILHFIIKNFEKGEKPKGAIEIAEHFKIPLKLTQQFIQHQADTGLLSEVHNTEGEEFLYQPAKDIHKLDLYSTLLAIEQKGFKDIDIVETHIDESIKEKLNGFYKLCTESENNVLIKDL